MSKIADSHIIKIEELADKTGYSFDYLYERYSECMAVDGDFDHFVTVTLERDW
ncbi:MAG TPA: hypothetical protein PKB13_11520 [Clostridia bacterium]|nr:hypothetical protein [Clostridia bacterium]